MASNFSGTIKQIPNVTINGTGANGSTAFGGHIFSVDYEVGITTPSKLTLSFLSESGTYIDPTLSVARGQGYSVSVGNLFTDTFYAYRAETTKSSQGRRLDVAFFDGSIILDQIWVGLHKKQGDKNQKQPPSLIILGSEDHPCDINGDRVYDKTDIGLIQYDNQNDPCRLKCPGQNAEEFAAATAINPILIECQKKYLMNLLDVQYNFAELIYYIKSAGIPVGNQFVISRAGTTQDLFVGAYNDFYYQSYTGSLRDVLARWCDDLALIYYWEKGTLYFMDVSKRPKVVVPNFDCVSEQSSVRTLEGTTAQGAITYYGREGEIYDNDCTDPQRNQLTCLTLTDLYGTLYKPTQSGGSSGYPESAPGGGSTDSPSADEDYVDDVFPSGMDTRQLEISCICAYYDERLRTQNVFYNYYNIQDPTGAINRIGKRLDRYGGMKILDVYCRPSGVDAAVNGRHPEIWAGLKEKTDPETKATIQDQQGYFILAELDFTKLENQFHTERNLASNFIGRHWIKAYYQAYQGTMPQVTPVGQYIQAGNAELKDLEFNHFYHANNSNVAIMDQRFKQDPRSNSNNVFTDSDQFGRNALSLLYYQKNAVWFPDLQRANPFKTLLDSYGKKLPGVVGGLSDDVKLAMFKKSGAKAPVGISDKDYAKSLTVMFMYPGYEFTVTKQRTINPGEEDQYYQLVPSYRQATSSNWPRLYYGLTQKTCYVYVINGVPVYTPAGASVEFNYNSNLPLVNTSLDGSAQNPIAPSFIVLVNVSTRPHVEIPKVETTMMTPPPSDNCMKVEYIVKDVNNNNIAPLNNMPGVNSDGIKKCTLSLEQIKAFHDNINENLTFSVTDEFVSEKITVPGLNLPDNSAVSISNGLEGFSIRLDENSAVVTSFSFGNSLFKKVSTDVQIKALELGIKGVKNQNNSGFFSNIRPQASTQNAIPAPTNQGAGNYVLWQQ